ncbi:von Willebrand factor type A domain protein [Polystyrenella longa]|uniref:von Willebrand factor type A domain protein n=1 Tax=Polystyrenella longa TaxID=2528007 RepID=A0A518CIY7_9PLAN|nr:VWA domain-containing protein [Polystyrenella longa]QDU79157.1 von Willebrand factor type A domain protein [Polystyrenella longa]
MWNSDLQLELTHPLWLMLLFGLPLLVLFFYRSLVDFTHRQRLLSLLTRAGIVLLLVLALAGLTILTPSKELFVVVAVDQSLSVGKEAEAATAEFLQKTNNLQSDQQIRFVPFANHPGLVQTELKQLVPPGSIQNQPATSDEERPKTDNEIDDEAPETDSSPTSIPDKRDPPTDPRRGTNIAQAIETARAAIPPHYVPRIVILTEGNETAGSALETAAYSDIPIYTVPLPGRDDPEVQVSEVLVPAQVAQGEPFYVEVVINSNHDDEIDIQMFRGPHKVVEETQKITAGENRFRFRQTVERERLAEFSAAIQPKQDTFVDNNQASGLVYAIGKPRVLLVDSQPEQSQFLAWALEEEGINVDTRPPEGLPDTLSDLQNYEAILISNVPATDLSTHKMDIIRTYVSELGGGLIMLGGDQSFGLGGYYKTVMEEVLPVRSDFEKEKEKPSLAMVLIIDKSGSMGGQKIELAKEAAVSAVELLGPRDQIGVIAFEGSSYWASEIRPRSEKSTLVNSIRSIEAGGGTTMYPAMDMAYTGLQSVAAKLKHVIILTDGHSSPGDFAGISQTMASSRITLSTVGVGDGADQNMLQEIAQIGKGRYYFTTDPASIPQIFAKETMTASKSAINEEPFIPQQIRSTPVLDDTDIGNAPFLLGYVITRPKATSEIILSSEAGDPLLVWWRYGLGMSVAFTSDANSRWAAEWLSWPGYSKFWAQLVRHTMRKSENRGVNVDLTRQDQTASLEIDAVNLMGQFLNNAETELTLIDPLLKKQNISLDQIGPGKYKTSFDVLKPGAYHLELTQKQSGQIQFQQSRGLIVGYPDELRLKPTNTELLESLAEMSGGKYDPTVEEIFQNKTQTVGRPTPLWPYLLAAALLLFLIDVALRRIDLSLFLPGWVGKQASS